jgi:hypothetical protein
MKKSLFLFICIVMPYFLIQGQSHWIEKKSDVGNFYLSFPSVPSYTFSSFHGWTARDKNGQVTYFMSFIEAPSNVRMSMSSVEQQLLPSLLEGDIQISKRYITFSGYPALDFYYKTNNVPQMYKRGLAVVKGQNLYILQVHYFHENLIDFNRFTGSLRFF